jgi:hypothetical protein
MTKREMVARIEAEGIDPVDVSLAAVNAFRVALWEKSGVSVGFMEAVVEMYGKDEDGGMEGDWIRMDGECRV